MAYTAEEVDSVIRRLERDAERCLQAQGQATTLNSGSKVVSAEWEFLTSADVAREVGLKAVKGEKKWLDEVFGGTCERIGRLQMVLDSVRLSDKYARDARWLDLRGVVETIQAVLQELGTFKSWMPSTSKDKFSSGLLAGGKNVEELKSLVLQTLETNGVLGQIRAQLRLNVYKAIDCDEESIRGAPKLSVKLLKSPVGKLMAEIVAEFFDFYQFRHSLSVFLPESHLGKERRSRAEVAFDAGLVRVKSDTSILEQLVGLASSAGVPKGGDSGWHSSASSTTASSPPPQHAPVVSAWQPHSDTSAAPQEVSKHEKTGQNRSLGERARSSAATALTEAISSSANAGGGGSRSSTLTAEVSERTSLKDEVRRKEDDFPDENPGGRDRRKLLGGKLPALSAGPTTPTSGTGKDLLPPLRTGLSVTSPSGSHNSVNLSTEEVSLSENQSGLAASGGSDVFDEMDRKFDRHLARLNRTVSGSGTSNASDAPKTEAAGAKGRLLGALSSAVASKVTSPPSKSHELTRSISGSPVTSRAGSPERSQAPSPAASSRSISRSLGSEVPEATAAASGSEPGTPPTSHAKNALATSMEESIDAISVDESAGSGSLDLTVGRTPDTAAKDRSTLPSKSIPADDVAEEVQSESIEERFSEEGSFCIEGCEDNEDHQSSDDKF